MIPSESQRAPPASAIPDSPALASEVEEITAEQYYAGVNEAKKQATQLANAWANNKYLPRELKNQLANVVKLTEDYANGECLFSFFILNPTSQSLTI